MTKSRRQRDEDLVASEIPLDPVVTEIVNRLPIDALAIRTQRDDVLVASLIPTDLVIEILKRLPFKSLARFKCVSKLWSSLIRSQGYLFASPPHLFISFISYNPIKSRLLSLSSTTSKKTTAFDLDFMIDGIGGYDMVSLRGLILYHNFGEVSIYNPTTKQRVDLPAIKANKAKAEQVVYFLGYDPVLDQYKIVCTIVWSERLGHYAEHWVFVLQAESSWKKINFRHPHFPKGPGLCINGVVYYLADGYDGYEYKLICFDVRSEKFNTIQLPHELSGRLMFRYSVLIEYGGKPNIFDYMHLLDPSGLLNLWVLDDAGIWSKKCLVLQPCQMHFFKPQPQNRNVLWVFEDAGRYLNDFDVIGTTQNGEVILKPGKMSYPYYILYYDLHKNDVRKVDIRGLSDHEMDSDKSFYLTMMDTGESIMHLEI